MPDQRSGTALKFPYECAVCGAPDEDNCYCDDPNFVDDQYERDAEARERLAEEDQVLYGI